MPELLEAALSTIFTAVVASGVLTTILIWISKSWLSERLKNSIKHEYERNLEEAKAILKSEHDQNLELLKHDLKVQADEVSARLQASLQNLNADHDARRDYEYEARKRLYAEYEPLLFELVETCESAFSRIQSLARTARHGDLVEQGTFLAEDGDFVPRYEAVGWLGSPGYYMVSTIYKLLAPIAVYKIMKRRLTFFDLQLEPRIDVQYSLAKSLYLTLTCDFELAGSAPSMEYSPNVRNWPEKRFREPQIYWRQGLPLGRLDTAAEELLRSEDGILSLKTFGDYEEYVYAHRKVRDSDLVIDNPSRFWGLADIFLGFHPRTRPILWRSLIAQAHIHRLIMRRIVVNFDELLVNVELPSEERLTFDWRRGDSVVPDEEVLVEPFAVATEFVRRNLVNIASLHG